MCILRSRASTGKQPPAKRRWNLPYRSVRRLKRPLKTAYDMTPDEYRARWNLPSDYPMVAPSYAEKRRELAVKIGLGRKPGQKRGRKKKTA